MPTIEDFRAKEFAGIDELAAVADSLVALYVGRPDRGNVRLRISTRTARHYFSEGLLGESSGQFGASLLFNYGNLLRLLAVKKLLSQRWSAVKINELVKLLDITALEELVNRGTGRGTSPRRLPINWKHDNKSTRKSNRNSFDTVSPAVLASVTSQSDKRSEVNAIEWVEIAAGLEVRVRGSFRKPRTAQDRKKLDELFWAVVDRGGRKR